MKKYTLKQKYLAAIEVIKDLQRYRCRLNNCKEPEVCVSIAPDYITHKLKEKKD